MEHKPLHELAIKLRRGPPSYLKCAQLVFPSWTKKRALTWMQAERKIPTINSANTAEYVAAFDRANHLKAAHTFEACELCTLERSA